MGKLQLIEEIEREQLKNDIPQFRIGDTLNVHIRIIEGSKERIQIFTGVVIARKGNGLSENISLYRVSYGSAMERVFMIHSPRVAKIELVRSGKVRRSKLYHLRGRFGKASKVKERLVARKERVSQPSNETPAENS